jgi:hypothetical protein
MKEGSFMRGCLLVCMLSITCLAAPVASAACVPYIEEHPSSTSVSFRQNSSMFEACKADEETYVKIIRDWLQTRAGDLPAVTSIGLGRTVNFPWMSRYLADSALQSADWARVARTGFGEHNKVVVRLLTSPEFLRRLAVPFEGSPYIVTGVSVEKVLVGRARDHATSSTSNAKVPFDVQLWLRLAPKP